MNERIEELRSALGLSQDKFGEALGVTRTAVCAWENGRRATQSFSACYFSYL